MEKLKLKLHAILGGFEKGQIIGVNAKDGIPLDKYWRDRIKDSKIDGCVSIVKVTAKKKATQEIKQ